MSKEGIGLSSAGSISNQLSVSVHLCISKCIICWEGGVWGQSKPASRVGVGAGVVLPAAELAEVGRE